MDTIKVDPELVRALGVCQVNLTLFLWSAHDQHWKIITAYVNNGNVFRNVC